MKVGQKIRSFDFEPRDGMGDCFMEGNIVDIDNGMIVAETTRVVFDGKEKTIDDMNCEFTTAQPGALMFGEWDGRVTVIS